MSALLITMILGGLFFHRLYAAKLRAIREARFLVWQSANSRGCGGTNIDLQDIVTQAVAGIGRSSGGSGATEPARFRAGVAGGSRVAPSFFGAIAQRSQTNSSRAAAPGSLGGGSYELRASNTVACNETPGAPRGDMLSIFGFAARNVLAGVWGGGAR